MWSIYKKDGKDLYNFTDLLGEFSLRSSEKEISQELKFRVRATTIDIGDIIILFKDGKKVFEGIVVEAIKNEYTKNLICYDYGWYLNKNEDMFQFNTTVTKAITRLLNEYEIPIGEIAAIDVVYKNTTRGNISEIIKEMIEYAELFTDEKYYWQINNNKFYLKKQSSDTVVFTDEIFDTDITTVISNAVYKKSIDDLCNAIKIVNTEKNQMVQYGYAEDKESIEKYGRLQKVEVLSKKKKSTGSVVANSTLKKLSKPTAYVSAIFPGVIECKANVVLEFDGTVMGIEGKFKITDCVHNVTNASHTMTLELEAL